MDNFKIILSIFLIYYVIGVIGVIGCINELLKDRDLTFTCLIGILLAYWIIGPLLWLGHLDNKYVILKKREKNEQK